MFPPSSSLDEQGPIPSSQQSTQDEFAASLKVPAVGGNSVAVPFETNFDFARGCLSVRPSRQILPKPFAVLAIRHGPSRIATRD